MVPLDAGQETVAVVTGRLDVLVKEALEDVVLEIKLLEEELPPFVLLELGAEDDTLEVVLLLLLLTALVVEEVVLIVVLEGALVEVLVEELILLVEILVELLVVLVEMLEEVLLLLLLLLLVDVGIITDELEVILTVCS